MKLLCLLAVVTVVAGVDPVHPPHHDTGHSYNDPTLDDVTALVEAIESDTRIFGEELSEQSTVSSILDDKLATIHNSFLPAMATQNSQQARHTEQFRAQLKTTEHDVDAAITQESRLSSLVAGRIAELGSQKSVIDAIADSNAEQQHEINQLKTDLASAKMTIIGNLNSNVAGLGSRIDGEVVPKLDSLTAFVNGKRCEYGTVTVKAGENIVNFVSTFDTPPSVSLTITGFSAHLDQHSYDDYYEDILSVKKSAIVATTTGFTIQTEDLTEGKVHAKETYCSYMACQMLDEDLPHV